MTDEEINALIERATAGVEPGDVVTRLDTLLRLVVQSIGERAYRALAFHCVEFEREDARNAR